MKIVVTGASGQFGWSVTELLRESVKPEDLILLSRSPDKARSLRALFEVKAEQIKAELAVRAQS